MTPKIFQAVISGRDLFVCDLLVAPESIAPIAETLYALHFTRREASHAGAPVGSASADLNEAYLEKDALFAHLLGMTRQLFPGENLVAHRAYVNSAVYGDSYYLHRDCAPDDKDVTILYYANPVWQPDWGGETVYFDDSEDARLVVTPKPGRVVIARGAILHRGGIPTRTCTEERRTIAYKLMQQPIR